MEDKAYSQQPRVLSQGFVSLAISSVFCWIFHSEVRSTMTDCVPSSSIRAFLLIENRLLREALVRLFRKRSDLEVVGQASPTDETPLGILESRSNALVRDSLLPCHLQGSFVAKGSRADSCRIILVGMEPDEEQFIAAVRSGVTGYLLQDASASDV